MSTAELIESLKRMDNADRLSIIEAASRLIREEFGSGEDERLLAQAQRVKDLYSSGGDLTEWTMLDSEEILDDSLPR